MFSWIEGLLKAWRTLATFPFVVGAACTSTTTPIQVPPELAAHVRLELSGAVWSASLNRYVLVSDDIGGSTNKHAPLLFTMTAAGKLDPEPIVISGVDELNDPESIAAGPDGTLFVCTSHSVNKQGHTPSSRRRLLWVSLGAGRTAQVNGQVDLTTARDQSGKPPWGEGAALDIEALAFQGGALYFGLKSPLSPDGSASIFTLPDAIAVLKSGSVPQGALRLWSRARFCVTSAGRSVCEGIADLAFMKDGSLLIAANSPKGMPKDGGGALWKLSDKHGVPVLLRRFTGLKPEGVALTPDHTSAIVVFDNDGQTPSWTQCPL